MGIIRTHDVTLIGGNEDYKIVLRPLSDEHLPYLYKWNADPEILYWTEGGREDEELSYPPEVVEKIYGGISQTNLCFVVEVNQNIIGECWLQEMNYSQVHPVVTEMYKNYSDVRRIDMCIGEKDYWGKGIGIFVPEEYGKRMVSSLCLRRNCLNLKLVGINFTGS